MENNNGLTPEFFEVYKKIENISIFGGYDLPLTRVIPNGTRAKLYKFICFVIMFWYSVLTWYAVYDNRKIPLALLLAIGSTGCVLTSISISYDFLWYRQEYKEMLLWVVDFHLKYKQQFGYMYKKAFSQSKRIIKATVTILAMTQIIMLGFGCLVQLLIVPVWTEEGDFNIKLPFPTHFPWLSATGWVSFSINYVHQHLGQMLAFNAYALFMIVNSVILVFIGVQLDILGELVCRISDKIQLFKTNHKKKLLEEIQMDLKDVMEMHVELTEYINKLISLSSRTYFTFKINAFVFAFYIYVALSADKSNQIQALGGLGGLSMSFWISYFCSIFDDANKRLLVTVNNIPWYELPPNYRPILVPFILKLQKPSLLKTNGVGAAQIISFEQFATTIQTVYSWCLVIQKVVVK